MNEYELNIYNWLYPCPHFQELFFMVVNTTKENDKETIITPEISGEDETFTDGGAFIDGSGFKQRMFNIAQYINIEPQSNSTQPIVAWNSIKQLQAWVIKQVKDGKLPTWDSYITEITVTGAKESANDNGAIKGQFQIIIKYFYEGEM